MVVEEKVTGQAVGAARHPLDPLSAAEIEAASEIVRRQQRLGEQARFVLVALHEPAKASAQAYRPGEAFERRAFTVVLDRGDGAAYEGVVNLSSRRVESWRRPTEGGQPTPLVEEFRDADAVVRADPGWQAALRRRGVTDISKVQIDPWPGGNFGYPEEVGKRILRAISYVRETPAANGYARPIEGLVAVVDLVGRRVLRLIDEGNAPIPEADCRFDLESVGPLRTDLKPLEIVQPEGVSFTLDGHDLRWQRWRMRVSHHPREGLVLHQIAYEDQGVVRPICYRASMAEMVVPYGDPSPSQYFKNAFDSGEVGLGRLANSLVLGCDCLGEIHYLDGVVGDDYGKARTIQNAICIHEEDFSLLWKHTDGHNDNATHVRRSRRLVVSSIATVGNYDYGFYWYFYQDGSWEQEVKATGIVQTQAVADGEPLETKQLIAKNLAAPIHHHFFCFRLDMDVDGPGNCVLEVDTEPVPAGPANPLGNAFRPVERLLASEATAQRSANSLAARHWRVVNPNRRNAIGQPTGYALFPGEVVAMMASEGSAVAKRATFARKQLWVTPEAPDERYPGGDYPNQSLPGAGLPAWTKADRPLVNQDVVLWYTVGVNHIVRPEDWPVTPVHRAGFKMQPWGFFDRNPALDVPPPTSCAEHQHGHAGHGHGDGHAHVHGDGHGDAHGQPAAGRGGF